MPPEELTLEIERDNQARANVAKLLELCEPIHDFLYDNYSVMHEVNISFRRIQVINNALWIPNAKIPYLHGEPED